MREHIVTTAGTLLWLPVDRRQSVQVEAVRQCGQPVEDVAQVGVGVFPVALAGDDDRVDDGGALAGIGMSDKEPVFLVMSSYA